ncbi:hypothetical protein ACA910_012951 [Epithemia clementina (nom. ined.)]
MLSLEESSSSIERFGDRPGSTEDIQPNATTSSDDMYSVPNVASDLQQKRRRPAKVLDLRRSASTAGAENRVNNGTPLKMGSGRSLSDKVLNLSRSQRKQLLFENKKKGSNLESKIKESPSRKYISEDASKEHASCESIVKDTRPSAVATQTSLSKTSSKGTMKSDPGKFTNKIRLHVYDLISKDALMLLPAPFGCVVEIGRCFANMNSALHELGTGAYHVGVEINGVEYAFGATSQPGRTGVFTCFPKMSPGYQYRSTIDLGERALTRRIVSVRTSSGQVTEEERSIEATTVLKEMAREYMGTDYDILRKNCCSFACDACHRLGVPDEEIPSWFRNLAESGAATQDVALATVQPIASVLSSTFEDAEYERSAERQHFALRSMCE